MEYIKTIRLSFYSGKLYHDVFHSWTIKNVIIYILLFAALVSPLTYIDYKGKYQQTEEKYFAQLLQYTDDGIYDKIIEQLPEITISNGNISTTAQQPYKISDPSTGNAIATIDTTGTYKTPDDVTGKILVTNNAIYILSDKIYGRYSDKLGVYAHEKVVTYKIPQNIDITVNQATAKEFLDKWQHREIITLSIVDSYFFLPLVYIFMIISIMVLAALSSLAGVILSRYIKPEFHYMKYLMLSAVAVTPIVLLNVIFSAFGIGFLSSGFSTVLFFAIQLAYLVFAIKSATVNVKPPPVI